MSNLSLYGCGLRDSTRGGGIVLEGASASAGATNIVAAENHPADFVDRSGASGSWRDSSHNVSSDASAPGPLSMTGVSASAVFLSPSPDVDNYHLRPDSIARNSGVSFFLAGDLDVDGEARPSTGWDRGADEIEEGAGSSLLYFGARRLQSSVVVQWVTRNEIPGIRFRLSRGATSDGPWQAVVTREVAGLVASAGNTSYFVQDDGASDEAFYLLELSSPNGTKNSYGPVSLGSFSGSDTFALNPSDIELGPASRATIVYGNPGSTSWRVLQRDEHHIDLELTLGGFTATASDRDPFILHVEKGEDWLRFGPFSLPVFRTWLEGLRSGEVTLGLVRSQNMVSFSPETEGSQKGGDPNGVLPLARILKIESRGADSDVLVELAPLRWNGANGTLTLARRIVVRLTLGPEAARESESSGAGGVDSTRRRN